MSDEKPTGSIPTATIARSSWQALRASTPARIDLGRTGDTMPLRPVLDFQLAHARARDAVHAALDVEALRARLAPRASIVVASAAADRATYLRRPDLGRVLSSGAQTTLNGLNDGCGVDCVLVLADGLSADAVQRHAPPLLDAFLSRSGCGAKASIVIATQARVAIADEIGAALGARLSIILIGERPGLSVADSLGIYVTHSPRPGRLDSERNCISNIHTEGGLDYMSAAAALCWLVEQALRLGLTGVGLKVGGQATIR